MYVRVWGTLRKGKKFHWLLAEGLASWYKYQIDRQASAEIYWIYPQWVKYILDPFEWLCGYKRIPFPHDIGEFYYVKR